MRLSFDKDKLSRQLLRLRTTNTATTATANIGGAKSTTCRLNHAVDERDSDGVDCVDGCESDADADGGGGGGGRGRGGSRRQQRFCRTPKNKIRDEEDRLVEGNTWEAGGGREVAAEDRDKEEEEKEEEEEEEEEDRREKGGGEDDEEEGRGEERGRGEKNTRARRRGGTGTDPFLLDDGEEDEDEAMLAPRDGPPPVPSVLTPPCSLRSSHGSGPAGRSIAAATLLRYSNVNTSKHVCSFFFFFFCKWL